jgi:hypothetical protein
MSDYAFEEYLIAYGYNNSNPELNYKTGVSALFSGNREEAAGFLLKAYDLNNDVAGDILVLCGRALQYSFRFEEAIVNFKGFLKYTGKKDPDNVGLARKCIDECNSALALTRDSVRVAISNLDYPVNSDADEYSEILSADGKMLYFCSRRKISETFSINNDAKFDENILISRKTADFWESAESAGENLTTKHCETPLYISSDNSILYIYAGSENGGDIKMSTMKKGKWKKPVEIPYNINSKKSETSFSFTPSGNEIYFVTNSGRDNLGGKDIYFIKKVKKKKWSKPQNAGSLINTPYDEESVRFSATGDTLWFSSRGHDTMGGYDIFLSVRDTSGGWMEPKNAGYPVNTQWNELFYHPSPFNDSTFYFVSNRSGGFGGLDIYMGKILSKAEKPVPLPSENITAEQTGLTETGAVAEEKESDPAGGTPVETEKKSDKTKSRGRKQKSEPK